MKNILKKASIVLLSDIYTFHWNESTVNKSEADSTGYRRYESWTYQLYFGKAW